MGIVAYIMVQAASTIDVRSLSMKSGILILVIGCILEEYLMCPVLASSSSEYLSKYLPSRMCSLSASVPVKL